MLRALVNLLEIAVVFLNRVRLFLLLLFYAIRVERLQIFFAVVFTVLR